MDILLSVLAFLFTIVGIIGCIVPIIPGTALSFIGLLCAYWCGYSTISATTIWIWLAASVVVSLIDYFLPGYMTKIFGGSRAATIGATVGVFAGLFVFPPFGMIFGPLVGAVVGELMHDGSNKAHAVKVGLGAFLSFIVGTGIKLVASIGMFVVVCADTFPALQGWITGLF